MKFVGICTMKFVGICTMKFVHVIVDFVMVRDYLVQIRCTTTTICMIHLTSIATIPYFSHFYKVSCTNTHTV